jgi:hypothetical protein
MTVDLSSGEAKQKTPLQRMGEYIMDAWDEPWFIDEARPTAEGFAIFLGRPRAATGPMGKQTIITADLVAYFDRNRRNPGAMTIPLAKTTITRIRAVLGHHRYQDLEMWWLDRLIDLQEMTTADFCVRHRISSGAVSQARQYYLKERRIRDANWWRTGEMREMLLSKMPSAWIAQKTSLAAVTIRKYRSAIAVQGQ